MVTPPPILLNIRIPEIIITGVKTPRALIDKEIVGTKLEIKNPSIEIIYTMAGKDSVRNIPTKEVYEQILGDLNQISVDTVELYGANIKTNNLKTKRQTIELSNAFIHLVDVKIDSAANADTTRLLFSKTVSINCDKLSWLSANNLYRYGADTLSISSAGNSVYVKKFYIAPQLAEDAFVRSLPTQDDRFDFSVKDIRITNINFNQLLNESIMADSMLIGSASFKIYRDLNIVRDKKNRVGTYPHQSIEKIPIPVDVKVVALSNSFIEYKERSITTKQTGRVQFHNVQAVIKNLTNNKELIAENNIMSVDIYSSFMGMTPLHILWSFYLNNPNGRFDVKGNLGSFNAKALNVLTEPMGPARLEDGTIKSVSFNLAGHDYAMDGSVKMIYDDLKVAILEKDEETKKLDKKKLASFAANIVIKNSNPSGKNDPRVEQVHFDRNTNRSIFHLSWKTLFKGIKETVGIKK